MDPAGRVETGPDTADGIEVRLTAAPRGRTAERGPTGENGRAGENGEGGWAGEVGPRFGTEIVTMNGAGLRWQSWDSLGHVMAGSGQAGHGHGQGLDDLGRPYTYTTQRGVTTTVTELPEGYIRTKVTRETDGDIRSTWVTTDADGKEASTGHEIYDKSTGTTSRTSVVPDGSGGTITSTSTPDGTKSTQSEQVDASGEKVETSRSVSTEDGQGNESKTEGSGH